ncbi:AsnC family transcriptional regulator [Brevundimonas sp. SORGH_AS_0993]|uniref:AsnC family transcriptional regulator n=1 Tax=Brevundimonas sp. SORGH_AS_0993 TaxID=3041794 RepID=UPI003592F92D
MSALDAIGRRLVAELTKDARLPVQTLAHRVGLSRNAKTAAAKPCEWAPLSAISLVRAPWFVRRRPLRLAGNDPDQRLCDRARSRLLVVFSVDGNDRKRALSGSLIPLSGAPR